MTDLVNVLYVRLFTGWLPFTAKSVARRAMAIKTTVVSIYEKLLQHPERSESSKALIFKALGQVCGSMDYLGNVVEFLERETEVTTKEQVFLSLI